MLHVGQVDLDVGDDLALDDPDEGRLDLHDLGGAVGQEEVGPGLVSGSPGPVVDELQVQLGLGPVVDGGQSLWNKKFGRKIEIKRS